MTRRAMAVTAAVVLAAVTPAGAAVWALQRQLNDAFRPPLIPEVPHQ